MDKLHIAQLTEEYHLLKEELILIQKDTNLITDQLKKVETTDANLLYLLYRRLIGLRIKAANLRIKMGQVCCSITKTKANMFKTKVLNNGGQMNNR